MTTISGYLPIIEQKRQESERRAAHHRLVRSMRPTMRARIGGWLVHLGSRLTNERDDGYTLAA